VRRVGQELRVSGAMPGTRLEIRDLKGALVAAGPADRDARFALPSNSVYAVRITMGGQSRAMIR